MRIVKYSMVLLLISSLQSNAQVYKDPNASLDDRVNDLLSQMTLEEKLGQMTQAERASVTSNNNITIYFLGSVLSGGGSSPATNTPEGWADMYDQMQAKALATRLGIPLMYGTDAIHGNNNLYGATIFPHNIGMGCTRDSDLVQLAAHITAIEVAATGVDWTFSPAVAVPQDERWGRTYEGFSEFPDLVSTMGAAEVRGYQGDTLADSLSVISCAKVFLADGGTTNGINAGNAEMDEATLRAVHLPPFIAAVNNHVATVMAAYNSWNDQPMHGNHYLLTDVLKEELGFEGFVVSDWNGIATIDGSRSDQIKTAINAGIDMAMEPSNFINFIATLESLVNSGEVPIERIDDAVRRILRVKFELGLFEHPYSNRLLTDSVGTAYHRSIARKCVRESLVLLKKRDDILPLPKEGLNILVAGSNANDIGNQCGGWTLFWAGFSGNDFPGTSIYSGLQQVAPGNSYTLSQDASAGDNTDLGILVIGETPYAEYTGDRNSIDALFSVQDIEAVKTMHSYGIPVIVILVTGRPVNIQKIAPYADVIIAAWLPGTEGQGIADILFGDYTPSGKLSFTWPRGNSQLPVNIGDEVYDPLYPYGYGITSFDNSIAGSDPEFYSAVVGSDGSYLELSFNKKMVLPFDEQADFIIQVGDMNDQVQSFSFAPSDSFRVRLAVESLIHVNDVVYLDYTPGNFTSSDEGIVNEIVHYKVLNDSEIPVSGINEVRVDKNITFYPNPAQSYFYLKLKEYDMKRIQIVLYTMKGQKIIPAFAKSSSDNTLVIKTTDLPAGIYLMQVNDGNRCGSVKVELTGK
jgi:beta-glucosidase